MGAIAGVTPRGIPSHSLRAPVLEKKLAIPAYRSVLVSSCMNLCATVSFELDLTRLTVVETTEPKPEAECPVISPMEFRRMLEAKAREFASRTERIGCTQERCQCLSIREVFETEWGVIELEGSLGEAPCRWSAKGTVPVKAHVKLGICLPRTVGGRGNAGHRSE